jgi:cold shock CspA family protein
MTEKKSLLGCVKWFNNKVGYGFITLSDGISEQDIFVHHSALNTTDEQYKYLVQGEYVCFDLVKATDPDSKHDFFAGNVSGVNGGKLMCETRNVVKVNTPSQQKRRYIRPQSTRLGGREEYTSQQDEYRSVRDEYKSRADRDYDYLPKKNFRNPRSYI